MTKFQEISIGSLSSRRTLLDSYPGRLLYGTFPSNTSIDICIRQLNSNLFGFNVFQGDSTKFTCVNGKEVVKLKAILQLRHPISDLLSILSEIRAIT